MKSEYLCISVHITVYTLIELTFQKRKFRHQLYQVVCCFCRVRSCGEYAGSLLGVWRSRGFQSEVVMLEILSWVDIIEICCYRHWLPWNLIDVLGMVVLVFFCFLVSFGWLSSFCSKMLQSLTFTQFGQGPQPIATDLLINMQDGFWLKYYSLSVTWPHSTWQGRKWILQTWA